MSTTLTNSLRPLELLRAIVMLAILTACTGTASSASADPSPDTASASTDPCDADRVELELLIQNSPDSRLECFGGRSISFRGYVSSMIGVGTCTFSPIPGDGWLNLCAGEQRLLVAQPGNEEALAAYIPPNFAGAAPDLEQWIEATGHFDDAAAATCDQEGPDGPADDPKQVYSCRLAFVLEAAVPAE